MSHDVETRLTVRPWRRRMVPRDTAETHRVATPLELFFDLCFVVAVAAVAARLHHALAAGDAGHAVVAYLTVFFAIWWAWMNFTWFASAYDCDDVPYRAVTLVQITGVLVLAAGVPRAFDRGDFVVITLGYAVMRVGLLTQWLRAAAADPGGRRTALRYAAGVSACMAGWTALLALPHEWRPYGWPVLVAAELAVPPWAELTSKTAWHAHHIAERYGLFTLIVLGESVLAASTAVQTALDGHAAGGPLYMVAAGGLLTVFSMWWLYFAKSAARLLTSNRVGFVWGYGHYTIFAAAAAVGAGLAVAVDQSTGHAGVSARAAGAALTLPVACYLVVVWALHVRPHRVGPARTALLPVAAALVLAATLTGTPVLVTGLVLTVLVVATEVVAARTEAG